MKALTGKTKEAFEKFLYDKYEDIILKEEQEIYWGHYAREVTLWDVYEKLPLELQQATLIEWLDSVGIYVDIQILPRFDEAEIVSVCWYVNIATSYGCYNSDDNYPTRQQATEKAIERAVELFNERSEK